MQMLKEYDLGKQMRERNSYDEKNVTAQNEQDIFKKKSGKASHQRILPKGNNVHMTDCITSTLPNQCKQNSPSQALVKKESATDVQKEGFGNPSSPIDNNQTTAVTAIPVPGKDIKPYQEQEQVNPYIAEPNKKSVEDAVVEEMNKRHAIVHISHFAILTEKKDPVFGVPTYVLETKQSLKDMYENKKVTFDGGKTFKSKADIWLKSDRRTELPNGITFNPRAGKYVDGAYNIWTGFPIASHQGECKLFWELVKNAICSCDENLYQYVRKWLAYVFQFPDVVHTALVLIGGQGVGKNTFVEAIGSLLGKHYVQLSNIHELTQKFNEHLKYGVLIFANEAIWRNEQEFGDVKSLITDLECTIEAKGKDRIRCRNFKHVIFASNDKHPVQIDHDDRRFQVLNVASTYQNNHKFFSDLLGELNNRGREALLYDLLHEDLSGFNPRILPDTSTAFDVKIRGAKSVEQYWYEALSAGCCDIGNIIPSGAWGVVQKDALYNDYVIFCSRGRLTPIIKDLFCKETYQIIPSAKPTQNKIDGEQRTRNLNLPILETARTDFQRFMQAGPEIWKD